MQFRDLKKQYELLKDDIDKAIAEVCESSQFINGAKVKELEKTLADYVGVKHCITCANGTDAITLAMKAWNIGAGDAVFVPDFTFFSSGECPACEGAAVIYVDVDENTFNIDPQKLDEAINRVLSSGKYRPRAVVAVDLFGLPADFPRIRKICDKYNLLLLEDGAQGFGGSINDKKACSFGDISTTSFFPAKPFGCYGDGGAVFTDNDEWANIIRSICVHGKDTSNPDDPNAKYNNIRLGMNSRLDTLQAGILLAKFDAFKNKELDAVNKVASRYNEKLKGTIFKLPEVPDEFYSSWAQYTIQLPESINRKELQAFLKSSGIPAMIYYIKPMHLQGAFKGTVSEKSECPVTVRLCNTVLSLPMHPYLNDDEIDIVCTELNNYSAK